MTAELIDACADDVRLVCVPQNERTRRARNIYDAGTRSRTDDALTSRGITSDHEELFVINSKVPQNTKFTIKIPHCDSVDSRS